MPRMQAPPPARRRPNARNRMRHPGRGVEYSHDRCRSAGGRRRRRNSPDPAGVPCVAANSHAVSGGKLIMSESIRATRRTTACNFDALEPRRLMAATLLTEVAAGALHANPTELTAAGDYLYFLADANVRAGSSISGALWELWRTDGTAGGTELIYDAPNRSPGSSGPRPEGRQSVRWNYGPRDLVAVGDDVYCYLIGNGGSIAINDVSVCRITPDGTMTVQYLGQINTSDSGPGGDLPEIVNVNGRAHL